MNYSTRGARVARGVWFLSWFSLYLEIFRWRHVVPSRIATVVWPDVSSVSQPGAFVRTVVVLSVVAPVVFFALAAAERTQRNRTVGVPTPLMRSTVRGAEALAVFGIVLGSLGAINQLVRQPPLVVDLTLQRGNGGFVVVGLALAAAGALMGLWRRRTT